jgi:hypothetical protein
MVQRVMARWTPQLSRSAEIAPACCNACRTCWTTNAIGLVLAIGGTVVAFLTRGRFGRSPSTP